MVSYGKIKKAFKPHRKNRKQYTSCIFRKRKVFVKRYLSPKGQRLVDSGTLTEKEADKKYGKNKYRINPNAKPVNQITHEV